MLELVHSNNSYVLFFIFQKYHKVLDGEANLTIGGMMLTKERSIFLAPSNPVLLASITFVFKENDAYVLSITRLLSPFQSNVWFAIGGIIIITMIITLLTKKIVTNWRHFLIGGRLNRNPILNMWSVILGNPISNPRMRVKRFFGTFARTLAILWIILWLIIRNSYQSGLYKHLQGHRFISNYDTVEKVQNSNCKIIVASYSIPPGMIQKER